MLLFQWRSALSFRGPSFAKRLGSVGLSHVPPLAPRGRGREWRLWNGTSGFLQYSWFREAERQHESAYLLIRPARFRLGRQVGTVWTSPYRVGSPKRFGQRIYHQCRPAR